MRFTCNVPRQELVLKLGTIVYELLGNTWNTLVETLRPKVGTICVLTKVRGNKMWLEAFNNDGSMIIYVVFKGATTLTREQLQLQLANFEKQTDSTFYKTFAQIHSQNRLAIHAKFIKTPNATYQKAKNHVNVHGQWRFLAQACHFLYTKIIRLKCLLNGQDLGVKEGAIMVVGASKPIAVTDKDGYSSEKSQMT
nr:hypothetical protein [Tanacetum cinerariifolium]